VYILLSVTKLDFLTAVSIRINVFLHEMPCKSKELPLYAWTGPKGSRNLRLTDIKTIGL
jgi:hypothetical protein